MADTINIRDTVVMAQTGRKMSQILLTYVTQTLGPTPTISGILRDLNEWIFTHFKIRGEKENLHNNAKGPLQCPSLRIKEGHSKKTPVE